MKLSDYPDAYLYVGRPVEERVLNYISNAKNASDEYSALQSKRSHIQLVFAVTFVIVSLLLTMAAIWIGLIFANRLALPISKLIAAADKVRAGDLTYRIDDINPKDELATLQRAFNRMTSQLDTQHQDLINANILLEQRRHFTEAVLSGVSVGVLAINRDGIISVANQASQELLQTVNLVDRDLVSVSGEIETLRLKLLGSSQTSAQAEINWNDGNEMQQTGKTFLARASLDLESDEKEQVIVTLDDITVLQAAQRTAAWSDVARRIAHEIKNPLTPIQLSAERLKRRYLKQIDDDPATFEMCIDTIIRQVGDIENMVTEFSAFSRLPIAIKKIEDLSLLCRQAMSLQEQARPDIKFNMTLPDQPAMLFCDRQQINQVLTNLIQNSVDAIDGNESGPAGIVSLQLKAEANNYFLIVEDNGKGLPEQKERLTEPYVTTRAKGTGLGLAIVKKILDEHQASLGLHDKQGGGARIEIRLPISYNVSLV